VLGTDELHRYIAKYSLKLSSHYDGVLGTYVSSRFISHSDLCMLTMDRHPRRAWSRFLTADNQALATPEAIDLLDRVLRYDHAVRVLCDRWPSVGFSFGL
jgi:casein kinase II subunit alpha